PPGPPPPRLVVSFLPHPTARARTAAHARIPNVARMVVSRSRSGLHAHTAVRVSTGARDSSPGVHFPATRSNTAKASGSASRTVTRYPRPGYSLYVTAFAPASARALFSARAEAMVGESLTPTPT